MLPVTVNDSDLNWNNQAIAEHSCCAACSLYRFVHGSTELPTVFVQVDVAFSVVRMETQYGIKHGVATSWLDRLAAPLTGPQAVPDPALVKASDDTLRVPVRGLSCFPDFFPGGA